MNWNTSTDRFNSTDRAVSPVIGVILMVAITVILAAVIGTFVLDLGQSAGQSAPSASLSASASSNADTITLSHKGGDGLQASNTRIVATNESDGNSTTWETTNASALSVGGEAVITVSDDSIDWGSTDTYAGDDASTNGNFDAIVSGTRYSIQLIDTESQRIIYETTITA